MVSACGGRGWKSVVRNGENYILQSEKVEKIIPATRLQGIPKM